MSFDDGHFVQKRKKWTQGIKENSISRNLFLISNDTILHGVKSINKSDHHFRMNQ